MTPEMRNQICVLKRRLDQCNQELSWHLSFFDTIREALDTARQSTECLLADDPFEAWVKMTEEACEAKKDPRGTVKRPGNVNKLITRDMQQQVADAKRRLTNYASRLEEFWYDLTDLKSFDAAVELAEDMECNQPLETRKVRK